MDAHAAVSALASAADVRDPVIQRVVDTPPADLLSVLHERGLPTVNGVVFVSLLVRLATDEADALLIGWLGEAVASDATLVGELLDGCARRGCVVPGEWVAEGLSAGDGRTRSASVTLAGLSGDAALVPGVIALLDDAEAGRHAAVALGRLGGDAALDELVARLDTWPERDLVALTAGLELLGDERAIALLRDWLPRAPERMVFEVRYVLRRLGASGPLVAPNADAAALRTAWERGADGRPAPTRVASSRDDKGTPRWELHGGRGLIWTGLVDPTPGAYWIRWSRAVYLGRRPLWHVGSTCGTCESLLRHAGWPSDEIGRWLGSARETLEDTRAWESIPLEELGALLGLFETGHFVARLLDVPLEEVSDPARSWFARREGFHEGAEQYASDPAWSWPGVTHWQTPDPLDRSPSTVGWVVPTQRLEALNLETVARWTAKIAAGAEPAAIALSWIDDRYIMGEHHERSLHMVLLDGHHRTAASVRRRGRARVLAICRIEDTWGPHKADRAQWWLDVTEPLMAAGSRR